MSSSRPTTRPTSHNFTTPPSSTQNLRQDLKGITDQILVNSKLAFDLAYTPDPNVKPLRTVSEIPFQVVVWAKVDRSDRWTNHTAAVIWQRSIRVWEQFITSAERPSAYEALVQLLDTSSLALGHFQPASFSYRSSSGADVITWPGTKQGEFNRAPTDKN